MSVVALGLLLRIRGLDEYWLNADEGIYYSTLTQPTFDAFWAEVGANAHPPGFYLLIRGLGHLTRDFVWLRASSLLFGVAAIWVFWRIGRALGPSGKWGAIVSGSVAATLLAVNPEAIVLSQVLRPYSLVVLLLGGALLALLEYRRDPTLGSVVGYALLMGVAVLTHYSAALALGVFTLAIVHDATSGHLERSSLTTLIWAHAVPVVLLTVLYVVHLAPTLRSEMMGDALDAGGWLSTWLIDSPAEAWTSLLAYQAFVLPMGLRMEAVALSSAAVLLSVVSRDRVVAVLTLGSLVVATAASAVGIYPLGPSRHSAWLSVFTLPAIGWLAGRLLTMTRPRLRMAAMGLVVLVFVLGRPVERAIGGLGSGPTLTNETEELVIRRADLAPLVVERMDPHAGPELIVMSEQSYYVLMPLYAGERQGATSTRDSVLAHFRYGSRQVVVHRGWEWSSAAEVMAVLHAIREAVPLALPDGTNLVQVVAGGWGSSLLADVPRLREAGAVTDQTWVLGRGPSGEPTVRMGALIVDPDALADLHPPAAR